MLLQFATFVLSSLIHVYCDSENCKSDWPSFSEVANIIIHQLKWKRAAIIHDNDSVDVMENLQMIELMNYEINSDTILTSALRHIHTQLFPDVNVILVSGNTKFLTDVLHEADGEDIKTNHFTDWTHHSKWLVFSSNLPKVQNGEFVQIRLEHLQNVATMMYDNGKCVTANNRTFFKRYSMSLFTLKTDVGVHTFHPVEDTASIPLMMFPNTKYRYNRRTLRVAAVESDPFVIKGTGSSDNIPYTGFCIDVLRTIAQHLNLTLEYVEAEDGIWGWIDDGMIGQLRRREIDVVANEVTVHAKRTKYIDYITPFLYTDRLILLYKKPPASEPILLLARPFQASVYILYLATTIAVVKILLLIEHVGAWISKKHKKGNWILCWGVIRSSLKQGDTLVYVSLPGRLLMGFWWLLVMLVSSLYCANLTASLAANSPLREFNTIDEVVDSDFSVGLIPGSIVEQIVQNSTQNDVKRLHEKIRRLNESDATITSSDLHHHTRRVQDGNYAYVTYNLNVDTLMKNDCNLSRLYFSHMSEEPMTFAVQKDSPFKEDIESVVYKLHTAGILVKMWDTWTKRTNFTECNGGKRSVTMTELIGAVIVGSVGIGLACLSLSVEWLIAHFNTIYTNVKS